MGQDLKKESDMAEFVLSVALPVGVAAVAGIGLVLLLIAMGKVGV